MTTRVLRIRPITQIITSTLLAVVFAASASIGTVFATATSPAGATGSSLRFNSPQDCDNNAILRCGAMTTDELGKKYNADSKAQTVYSWYGISRSTIESMGRTAVAGSVTKAGDVEVNGKVVAKDAVSAGYHKKSGSTTVTHNGVTFYNDAPSTSFVADRIDAFVLLNDKGQFVTAILTSCGNPVKARNIVPAPKPEQPKPEQPKPEQPKPVEEQPKPVEEQPKPVPAAPAAAVQPVPEKLVVVGPEHTIALFVAVSVLGTLVHAWYTRRKAAL